MNIKSNLFLFFAISFLIFSAAACTKSETLQNVPLYFYKHYLGVYNIYLTPALSAIESGDKISGYPYYKKKWHGQCPGNLAEGHEKCFELTVYPNSNNFSPNPMKEIKKYTHGRPNRGEVRILTNRSETKYSYTTDHEKIFCGPYALS
ncbi:MAG: hypothetical protein NTZ67_04455 [Gammaproteobacteria bacterium]|nr:hypothetical protein [Gammaproteobacteria bacterium]